MSTYTMSANGTSKPISFEARDDEHAITRTWATHRKSGQWYNGICWFRIVRADGSWFNLNMPHPQSNGRPEIGIVSLGDKLQDPSILAGY